MAAERDYRSAVLRDASADVLATVLIAALALVATTDVAYFSLMLVARWLSP